MADTDAPPSGDEPNPRAEPIAREAPTGGRQPISRDEVAHVARLARLELSVEELDRFTGQLAAVLDHARDLDGLDTTDLVPTAHPYPLANVLRDDEVTPSLERAEVLAQAPSVEADQFRVPSILGEAP